MPAVAVAGAVWAGEAVTAAMVFEALAVVGAVTSAVGVVTGDETLTKIGATLGVVGGIGSLASSAGMLADSAAAVSPGAEAMTGTAQMAETAASAAPAASTAAGSPAAEAMSGAIPETASAVPTVAPDAVTAAAAPAAAPAAAAPAPSGILNSASPASSMYTGAADPSLLGEGGNIGVWNTLKSAATDTLKFAKDNQVISWGVMQAGGNLIGGMFDPMKPAQVAELQSRAQLEQAQQGYLAQQTANLASPAPAASITGVRPAVFPGQPVTYSPPGIGLINRVTGRTA